MVSLTSESVRLGMLQPPINPPNEAPAIQMLIVLFLWTIGLNATDFVWSVVILAQVFAPERVAMIIRQPIRNDSASVRRDMILTPAKASEQ